jgi:hypothetical protein
MLPLVFQTLKASAAVKAIVGTNPPRIYRHGSAPQDATRPYITWSVISAEPANHLSGTPSADRMGVQVDCWHQTDAGIEQLAEAARDAIEPGAHMTGIIFDGRDAETKLYRIGLQFDFWDQREDPASSI